MSADSSMGANTSNNADSLNDINDAAWNPVGDSPVIAPVQATTEVPPIEEVRPVEPAEPVQEEQEPVQAAQQDTAPTEQQTLAAVQEVLSTSISNLKADLHESDSSDEDMPPLISSSDEDESNTDSKEESDEDSKTESEKETDDSKEESGDSKDEEDEEDESENSEEAEEDPDEDLMVAVFQRPTCPRCDAALKALLTPSEDESETESSGSDSARVHRIRPKPTEIPTIILTLFKILLFLHVVQFLTYAFAPARRTYS